MIGIAEVRARAAEVLAPAGDDDPTVLGLTDAVVAPCLMLAWAQPWLVPNGQPPMFYARLEVQVIGGRVDAEGSTFAVEDLAAFVIGRFAARGAGRLVWLPVTVIAPRAANIGGVDYLAARLVYQTPVDGSVRAPIVAPHGLVEVAS